MWFLYSIYRFGYEVVLRGDSQISSITLALLTGIAGMLIHGMLTWLPRHDVINVTYWCMSALIIVMHRIMQYEEKFIKVRKGLNILPMIEN